MLDKHENLWIGTLGGLLFYPSGDFKNPKPQLFLEGKAITSLFEDREGNIWVTTMNNGVFFLSNTSRSVKSLFAKDGLPSAGIASVKYMEDGTVWLGAHTGEIVKLKDGKMATYTKENGGVYSDVISIIPLNNEEIVVAGEAEMVFWKDGKPSSSHMVSTVKSIDYNDEGELLVGSSIGAWVINWENYKKEERQLFARIYSATRVDKLARLEFFMKLRFFEDRTYAVLFGEDDARWLGTIAGLYKEQAGELTFLGDEFPPLKWPILIMANAPDGNLWIGSKWSRSNLL